jgi:hypothetical protein
MTKTNSYEMSGAQIDWTSGQKYLCISPKTWAIRNKTDRLASAKEDLKRAGHAADAQLLNGNRLNTAFYKLDKGVQANHMAARAAGPPVPRGDANAGKKREREERAERRQGEMV